MQNPTPMTMLLPPLSPLGRTRFEALRRCRAAWRPLLGCLALALNQVSAAEPAVLPANATITSGDLTLTLPGDGWKQLPRSEGKIAVTRTAENRTWDFSVWPVDPAGPAQAWTPAQHTKAYFDFERKQTRDPGSKWTGFAESVRTIAGRKYPTMTFQVSVRPSRGAAVESAGAFLLIFPESPIRPGRFYVVMWTEAPTKRGQRPDWAQWEAIIGSLVIGAAATRPASAEEVLARLTRAKEKLGARDFAGAVADFNAVIASDPKSSDAFGGRGVAKLALGDGGGGMADLDRAIELNDTAIPAYLARGQVRAARRDLAGAISDFSAVLELDPTHVGACYQRAAAKAGQQDIAGAIQDLGRVIELQPANPNNYYSRGTLHRDSGNLDAALADLSKAIALKPDFANAYNNRGTCRRGKGDLEGALADFDQAIALNPGDHFALNNRAGAREAKKDYAGAIADLDTAIRLKPDWAGGYLSRGTVKKNQGDNAGAIADLTEAIRLQPANPQAFAIRAAAKAASGDADGAKADQARAVELSTKK